MSVGHRLQSPLLAHLPPTVVFSPSFTGSNSPPPNHRFPNTWFPLILDPQVIEVSLTLPFPCHSLPVIGALIGKQEGRNIEVMNSFELLSHTVEEKIIIDKEYYYTKEEQFKQVFKELEFLGWYTTGGPPDPSDIHVHKQVYMLTPVHAGAENGE